MIIKEENESNYKYMFIRRSLLYHMNTSKKLSNQKRIKNKYKYIVKDIKYINNLKYEFEDSLFEINKKNIIVYELDRLIPIINKVNYL